MYVHAKLMSNFATLWTVAHQAPLSMGFFRQEYWVSCHFLLHGLFPTQGSDPHLLSLLHWQADSLALSYLGIPMLSMVSQVVLVEMGQEDPLEEEMANRSSNLAWRIPRTEESGGLQSIGLRRVGHDWAHKHILRVICISCVHDSCGYFKSPRHIVEKIWGKKKNKTISLEDSLRVLQHW